MLVYGLIVATAALFAFGVGFLLGPFRKRHPGWLLGISAIVMFPWLVIVGGLAVYAAPCPGCYDNGEIDRLSGMILVAIFLGMPTFGSLALFWLGAAAGWILRDRSSTAT